MSASTGTRPATGPVLVAAYGRPGMRDLDFGRNLVRYLEELRWPEGVVVEELSCAAPLVLHRLQELGPARLVLVGAIARGTGAPGTLRRRSLGAVSPGPEEVLRGLEQSLQGMADLDHTLAVARHWGGLPADTVVLEVEPADCSFGPGFSDELAGCFDAVVAAVRQEVGGLGDEWTVPDFPGVPASPAPLPALSRPPADAVAPSEALRALADYAHDHARVRSEEPYRGEPLVDGSSEATGLTFAGCSRPWSVGGAPGGDWFDVIPLADGWFAAAVGDVPGRGAEAAGRMADLRAAVRAYAVLPGSRPPEVLDRLDRLARATGVGDGATLVYVVLHPATGEVCLVGADARSGPLGADPGTGRPEITFALAPGDTLLLLTDGLGGLERVRRAAGQGPQALEALCQEVLEAGAGGAGRQDDACVLALRMRPPDQAVSTSSTSSAEWPQNPAGASR